MMSFELSLFSFLSTETCIVVNCLKTLGTLRAFK